MNHELIDICFNFTHAAFREDEAAVLARALDAGVTTMMVTGSSVQDSQAAIALAERYPDQLYATAGVHPHLAKGWTQTTRAELRALAAHAKVRAIGEAGLDYNRNYSSPVAQRCAFEQQLQLACELDLPIFLHARDAHDDFIALLTRYRDGLRNAVAHCFTGDDHELDACLGLDLHIGITGWICDERRGSHLRELVRRIPSDRLMIETDAPYLAPRALRPQPRARRNEPALLPHILNAIAAARRSTPAEVAAQTTATAKRFYGLDGG
ncbi:MAG: TatD family hydrolase [Gammaproteobacteria bacterium]